MPSRIPLGFLSLEVFVFVRLKEKVDTTSSYIVLLGGSLMLFYTYKFLDCLWINSSTIVNSFVPVLPGSKLFLSFMSFHLGHKWRQRNG